MTRELHSTKPFKKDLKTLRRRRKDLTKLQRVIDTLVENVPLDPRAKPHRLSGRWSACWECHIEPDWLLVWKEDTNSVTLVRTGSHADLFE